MAISDAVQNLGNILNTLLCLLGRLLAFLLLEVAAIIAGLLINAATAASIRALANSIAAAGC
jgi:hypothetical protein